MCNHPLRGWPMAVLSVWKEHKTYKHNILLISKLTTTLCERCTINFYTFADFSGRQTKSLQFTGLTLYGYSESKDIAPHSP